MVMPRSRYEVTIGNAVLLMLNCSTVHLTYVWATVSALMCLVCPVLLSVYTVLYVLFYEQINGME